MKRILRRGVRVAAVILPLVLGACQSLIKSPNSCDSSCGDGCPHTICDPKVLYKPTVHAAAWDLDHLEKHIDWHGSVVAKVPDVWGQARLTLYREQFEDEMLKNLTTFQETLQGSVARSDQAFALSTTALGLALSGTPATTTFQPGLFGTPGSNQEVTKPVQQVVNPPTPVMVGVVQTTTPDGKTTTTTASDPAFFFNTGGTTFQPGNFKAAFANADGSKLAISLEPERVLEQKKRYLDLLAQIRRTNEGDDTADAPGYSLQLFRIPVSVLPGKHTDKGHGAEISMTLTPVLGDDLLPTTFRNLLTNDLLHQLGFPLAELLNDSKVISYLDAEFQIFVRILTQLNDYLSTGNEPCAIALAQAINKQPEILKAFWAHATPEIRTAFSELVGKPAPGKITPIIPGKGKVALAPTVDAKGLRESASIRAAMKKSFPTSFNVPTIGFAKGLDNRTAFPTSQLLDVYGSHAMFEVAFGTHNALQTSITRQKYVHLPDVQAHLKEEISAAYELLRKNPDLLTRHCTPELVQAIRSKRIEEVLQRRQMYRAELAGLTGTEPFTGELKEPYHLSVTAALGWCLIVDAALLNDRLMRDMREAATARGRTVPPADIWLPYYMSDPPLEARRAFNDYVAMRWPIHVFAMDPAIQEQNLADRLATRRELQLALSMAFVSGKLNFNQLNRYARRLEAEYETIDLNRTQIGFAHGSDTFGWRFYPRYQTPDTPGNLTVIARDLIIGGPNRNQLLRERRLEPGPRECVALVIMPSFVPAVRLDTTSNFFGLANPKHKVFDHTQAVKLGRTVQAIKNAGGGLTDVHCYRTGDAERLTKRAEQLEARLPLQTAIFPVPVESTLGGFEMFGTSTTDLSPELYGFYGAPGADTKKVTTLFLVGDHFSPLRTRVIVGNKAVAKDSAGTKLTMISRQVVQVDFGPDMIPLNATHVTVHIATPYGVSRELLVPVVNTTATQPDGYYLTSESKAAFDYKIEENNDKKFGIALTAQPNQKVAVQAVFANGIAPTKAKLTLSIGMDSETTAEALTMDQYGMYTLDGAKLKTLLEALIAKRFPAKTTYATVEQITQLFPQIIEVKIQPETPAGVLTPVSGILRLTFTGTVKRLPPPEPKSKPPASAKSDTKTDTKTEPKADTKPKTDTKSTSSLTGALVPVAPIASTPAIAPFPSPVGVPIASPLTAVPVPAQAPLPSSPMLPRVPKP